MEDFLTIIIPVYKIKEIYLRECIDSIIAERYVMNMLRTTALLRLFIKKIRAFRLREI